MTTACTPPERSVKFTRLSVAVGMNLLYTYLLACAIVGLAMTSTATAVNIVKHDVASAADPLAQEVEVRRKVHRGNIKVQEIPYVRLTPAEVRITGGCVFKGCPAGKPFVYYVTSYRNRGASYNRWVRSVVADVTSPVNQFPVACLCMAVADFNDVVSGPPIDAALEDWPYDKAVVSLHGLFSRAGGHQRVIDHVVTTPRDKSLVFFVDADMIAYPGLLNRIVGHTEKGVVSGACL